MVGRDPLKPGSSPGWDFETRESHVQMLHRSNHLNRWSLRQCIDALARAINKFSGGVVLATKP